MNKIVVNLLLVGLLLFLGGCSNTAVRHHQDYQEAANYVGTVVLLPADVSVELIVFDGDNEKLVEKEKSIQEAIHRIAKAKLEAEQLTVIDFDFDKEIATDEELAYALTEAKEAWNVAKQDMYKKGVVSEKDKAKFTTNLGSVLNLIADKTGADSALLMHFSGYEKSKGVVAKDLTSSILVGLLTMGAVVPVHTMAGSFVDIALVETTTGKVIWANRKSNNISDSNTASLAFKELPDLVWKTELANHSETNKKSSN